MSFYIRDISMINRYYYKSNADLVVSQELYDHLYQKMYKNIYKFNGLDPIQKVKKSKPSLYKNHNKDLYLLGVVDAEETYAFIFDRKYNSIELVLPPSFDDNDISAIVNQVALYFKDREESVGVIISNPTYIASHTNYLNQYGFYVSRFIPETIDIELEEKHLVNDIEIDSSDEEKIYCCALPSEKVKRRSTAVFKNKTATIKVDESFKDKLIKYLNKSNKTNVEVYTKGGITRKLFSKILSEKNYNPKKDTICCLIIGMELCLDDALDLLNAAGYTLTNSLLSDVIIKKHITSKSFDITIINSELDEHGQTMLGWKPREEA